MECRPCVSRQFTLSGVQSFLTRAKPFLEASSSAAAPLNRSWMSVSLFFTRSRGVFPSRFFLVGSAPCYIKEVLRYNVVNIALNKIHCHWKCKWFNLQTEQWISIGDLGYLKQQFADLVFALSGRLMQWRELPQVGHVHSTMKDEELSNLIMPIRTGIVQGNQTTVTQNSLTNTETCLSAICCTNVSQRNQASAFFGTYFMFYYFLKYIW